MKVSEINGCEDCPLNGECTGMKCYGGAPIEPPCCRWNPEDDLDDVVDSYYGNIIAREREIARKISEEQKENEKKELKKKRQRESKLYVHEENIKIKKLKKCIEGYRRLIGLSNAFSITNKMMRMEDDRPKQAKGYLQNEIDKLYEQINEIEKVKKKKLKELNEKRKLNNIKYLERR